MFICVWHIMMLSDYSVVDIQIFSQETMIFFNTSETALRTLDGQQINHHIFLKFLNMICLAIKYWLVMKKRPYILTLEYDYFVVSLYGTLHLKGSK